MILYLETTIVLNNFYSQNFIRISFQVEWAPKENFQNITNFFNSRNEYTAQRCSYLLLAHHNSFLKNLKNIGKAAKIPSCTTLYPNFRKTHKAMISESKNLQPIEIMTNYEAFTLNRLKVLSSHSCVIFRFIFCLNLKYFLKSNYLCWNLNDFYLNLHFFTFCVI